MLSSFAAPLAKEHATAIATDFIAGFPAKVKELALGAVASALKVWHIEQAVNNGTVEIAWPTGLAAVRKSDRSVPSLPEITGPIEMKRVPVLSLEPYQCAGPLIQSPADLLFKLWVEEYQPVREVTAHIGIGAAMAMLVERDGSTMPMESLLLAARVLWIFQRLRTDAYREQLSAAQRRRAESALKARTKKAQDAAHVHAHAEWIAMARHIWRREPRSTRSAVATEIRGELIRRQQQPGGDRRKRIPSVRTIEDVIKRVKGALVLELSGGSKRAPGG